MRKHAVSTIGGIGVATTFFLPIAAAGQIDAPILMWSTRHTWELAIAWIATCVLAAVVLARLSGRFQHRIEALVLLVLTLPSALSLVAVTTRNGLMVVDSSDPARSAAAVGAGAGLCLAVGLWVLKPAVLVRIVRGMLVFGALLLVPAIPMLGSLTAPLPLRVQQRPVAAGSRGTSVRDGCNSVYVLLFDELAYDTAFVDGEASLKSLASRQSTARIYHRAMGATESTDTAIAEYVSASPKRGAGHDSAEQGLFGTARSQGLQTEVVGWYFPYCESLGAAVDRCRSYSMYNASTLYDYFNPLAPFETVLNIWPYRMPTGIGKRPAAVWLHGALLEAIVARAIAPAPAGPMLRWVHLNVPHVPWLQNNGFLSWRAFEQTRERYVQQMTPVDSALERILSAIERSPNAAHTTVVVTADHGSRRGHAGEPLHVPLVVLTPGTTREDVREEVRVADVLKTVVSGACHQ